MALFAGPRYRRRPAFLFPLFVAGLSLASVGALAQPEAVAGAAPIHCDELPETRQALCWMVVACGALADEARREECYRVAAESLRHGGLPHVPAPSETTATPSSPAVAGTEAEDESVAAPRKPPPVQEAAPPAQTAAEPPSQVTAKQVLTEVLDIPRRFSARVTAQRKLVRNRQLLVLDDKLLFETDNADTARIEAGDTVDVVKASSRRGRNYQIVGPSKRAATGIRIRCERSDLSVGNRRKCAILPDRTEALPN